MQPPEGAGSYGVRSSSMHLFGVRRRGAAEGAIHESAKAACVSVRSCSSSWCLLHESCARRESYVSDCMPQALRGITEILGGMYVQVRNEMPGSARREEGPDYAARGERRNEMPYADSDATRGCMFGRRRKPAQNFSQNTRNTRSSPAPLPLPPPSRARLDFASPKHLPPNQRHKPTRLAPPPYRARLFAFPPLAAVFSLRLSFSSGQAQPRTRRAVRSSCAVTRGIQGSRAGTARRRSEGSGVGTRVCGGWPGRGGVLASMCRW